MKVTSHTPPTETLYTISDMTGEEIGVLHELLFTRITGSAKESQRGALDKIYRALEAVSAPRVHIKVEGLVHFLPLKPFNTR